MNTTQLTTIKANRSLLTRLCLVTASFALAATSAAATNENNEQDHYNKVSTAYVDSVLEWGAWELDIEPAAGGLQAQTTQALNARDSKVSLRTNSMSALAPQRPRTVTPPTAPSPPAPLPIAPPLPVPVPTITPISPAVPVTIGGPGDGF